MVTEFINPLKLQIYKYISNTTSQNQTSNPFLNLYGTFIKVNKIIKFFVIVKYLISNFKYLIRAKQCKPTFYKCAVFICSCCFVSVAVCISYNLVIVNSL